MKRISIVLAFLSAMTFGRSAVIKDKYALAESLIAPNFSAQQLRAKVTDDEKVRSTSRKVAGEQANLWEPVSEIEDGAVYMIRSAENPELVWDLTGGNLSNGTQVQLYPCNYSQAQKFYFKKQFDRNGNPTYRLSPLYSYDKVLKFTSSNDDSILKIGDEAYSDFNLFSDKIYFTSAYQANSFYAHTCFDNCQNTGDKYISVGAANSGTKVMIKDSASGHVRYLYRWELIKTDYMGLNVGNKTYVNGMNEFRYVARVPQKGRYVIETHTYGGVEVDTYLTLKKDSSNTIVATNDDGGVGRNAKITYNFQSIEEFSVLVRGYNSNYSGYCYVTLRPEKTIYLTGTYDIDIHKHDRTTPLLQSKSYLRNMGYFPEVQTNLNHNSVFSTSDWEDTLKIDRDYYFFRGHGANDGRYALYYDGANADYTHYTQIPNLPNAGLVAWIICSGAKETSTTEPGHCMARASAMKGAQFSLGFRSEIGTSAADTFTKKFIQYLASYELEEALKRAVQGTNPGSGDGLWQPSLFLAGGDIEYRYTVTRTTFNRTIVNW